MLSKNCEYCGNQFTNQERHATAAMFAATKYCSRRCTGLARRIEKPVWRCMWCDKEYVSPNYQKQLPHRFCSRACCASWRHENVRGAMRYNWKGGRKVLDPINARLYRERHPDRMRHFSRMRKYRLKGASGRHTWAEWEALCTAYDHRCAYCGEKKPLTRDHIIPIIRGGTNYITNIQPLCHTCNSRKSTRPDIINHTILQTLLVAA